MLKCRKVRTTLPKIHLQKYIVTDEKQAANYWVKKAVRKNTYMHKKEKDGANGMMGLYNASVQK